jgi:hypothetical protein
MQMWNIGTGIASEAYISDHLSGKDNKRPAEDKKIGREACKKLPALMVSLELNEREEPNPCDYSVFVTDFE